MNEGNFNWLEEFKFSTSSKYVLSSILVDFLDEINEYIPTIAQLLRGKIDEYCFQHIVEHNGTVQGKTNYISKPTVITK